MNASCVVRASATPEFLAETGGNDRPPRTRKIGFADQHPPRQKTNRTFKRAHMLVGDEDLDAVFREKGPDRRDQHEIVGPQEFDHSALLTRILARTANLMLQCNSLATGVVKLHQIVCRALRHRRFGSIVQSGFLPNPPRLTGRLATAVFLRLRLLPLLQIG
jgi:hypothetical protein